MDNWELLPSAELPWSSSLYLQWIYFNTQWADIISHATEKSDPVSSRAERWGCQRGALGGGRTKKETGSRTDRIKLKLTGHSAYSKVIKSSWYSALASSKGPVAITTWWVVFQGKHGSRPDDLTLFNPCRSRSKFFNLFFSLPPLLIDLILFIFLNLHPSTSPPPPPT